MSDSFTLDEFCTDAWSNRAEYAANGIGWGHITKLHADYGGLQECGKCDGTDIWYFLHMAENGLAFEFYLYDVCAWSMDGENLESQPLMWVCGTVFDGVRESSGAQSFSVGLIPLSTALSWLHDECCKRWPRFAAWYSA